MKIGIKHYGRAYVPEGYAYKKHLESRGHTVQLEEKGEVSTNNDINIQYMGFDPFWHKKKCSSILIHEYHSLSTPPLANIKDLMKSKLCSTPDGYIFLNRTVKDKLKFPVREGNYILRDMGIDEEILNVKPSENKLYDLVYCGSIKRAGLVEVLVNLAKKELKIIIVGEVDSEIVKKLDKYNNITIHGEAERKDIPEIYSNCMAGLNYTPDIYPFNIQTSTKTLEYLGAGLKLVTNRYSWVEEFCIKFSYEPIWLDNLRLRDDILSACAPKFDMRPYSWDNVLEDSKLELFLLNLIK